MKAYSMTIAQGVGGMLGVGLLLGLLGVRSASAAPCHVPSGAYPTIQAAMDTVTCAAINVAAGTYTERVVITRDVTLRGEDQERTIIDGNGRQVVTITSGSTVTIKNVTIQHGFGGLGGGISNDGTLTLKASTVANNAAHFTGGGIANGNGTLTIIDSTITKNHADKYGGGIINSSTLTIKNSSISDNFAGFGGSGLAGGGIFNVGMLTITDSTISDNHVDSFGGGISNDGTLTIKDSTILDNVAGIDGGGIFNSVPPGIVTLRDVILQNNTPNDCAGCP
jgi:hypothetical protein